MDLFGQQTVQMVVTAIQTAILLSIVALLIGLSVRVAKLAMRKPALVRVTAGTGRLVVTDRDTTVPLIGLQTSLPTRAPPGPQPINSSQDASRIARTS